MDESKLGSGCDPEKEMVKVVDSVTIFLEKEIAKGSNDTVGNNGETEVETDLEESPKLQQNSASTVDDDDDFWNEINDIGDFWSTLPIVEAFLAEQWTKNTVETDWNINDIRSMVPMPVAYKCVSDYVRPWGLYLSIYPLCF
ncbi:hypothetical protein Hanom_Chr06g00478981 [Helianthus anomalus]